MCHYYIIQLRTSTSLQDQAFPLEAIPLWKSDFALEIQAPGFSEGIAAYLYVVTQSCCLIST